jgi:hypothetical protein
MGAQVTTGLAGLWLVASVFLWPHADFQRQNSMISGALAMVLAVAGCFHRQTVFLGSLLAMWLYLSSILSPTLHAATIWSNTFAAIAIGAASLVSGCRRPVEQ